MTIGATFASAQQQACAYLRELILCGELRGDTSLDPAEIAGRLGISRMPVREALRQLDAEGLVTMRPNRKAVVTNLTAAEVEDLFEMRAVLEGLMARSAVPAVTPEAVAELRLMLQRMRNASHDLKIWIKRHDEFHQYICDLGGRPRLTQEIIRLRHAVQPYLLIAMTAFGKTELAKHEHHLVVDVLASGDPAKAESCIAAHVLRSGEIALRAMEKTEAENRPQGSRAKNPASSTVPRRSLENSAS